MRSQNIIIGAGISGLALGWFLKKRFGDNQDLTILEASERPGGWIRSYRDQGFLFEEGPRSCRSKGAGLATLQLIEELALCNEVISASPQAKKRYICIDGKLQCLPHSFLSFLRSPLMKGVLPALWKEWRIPPSGLEDELIGSFIERRLGKKIADNFMDPLVSGIYAGDINQLSMRACFPDLHRMEKEHGSLLKGMFRKRKAEETQSPFVQKQRLSPIFSFKNGMETLVSSLYDGLKENIQLSCCVQAINVENAAVEVVLEDGRVLKGDRVFLCVPSHQAARLLKNVDAESCMQMADEKHATVAVVNMGWHGNVLKHEGFGYLVPSSQKENVLGVVFDSSAFALQNGGVDQTRLTAMLGGMHRPEVEGYSSEEIEATAVASVQNYLGIALKPDVIRVSIARQAIPQYSVGHGLKLLNIENRLKQVSGFRIHLLGSAWRGVAVNDCIAEAKKMAYKL